MAIEESPANLRRKELQNSPTPLAPRDALLHQVAILVEAHLLDHLSVAGTAPIVGSFSDAGDRLRMNVSGRKGFRENGGAFGVARVPLIASVYL
jgi:hypothetical protein